MISLSEHLEKHGVDPLRADLLAEFVGAVMVAISAAEASLKTEAAWSEFCAAAGAFGKPRKRGLHAMRCLPTEEGISGELVDRMNDYLRATGDDHILRKWHVTFDGEARVRSKIKKGKYAARTDIRARGQKMHGPEFILEAKMVETPSQVRARLLGPKGLGCFTGAEPYSRAQLGGLLAYTVQGEGDTWLDHIEAKYADPPPIATKCERIVVEPSAAVAVLAPVARVTDATPILMLNMVLRFDSKPG